MEFLKALRSLLMCAALLQAFLLIFNFFQPVIDKIGWSLLLLIVLLAAFAAAETAYVLCRVGHGKPPRLL